MKKYKYEIIIFLLGAIYMILELVCSRVLAPYFGTSNLVWTSVIGIILLSSSVGNYIGGFIADKNATLRIDDSDSAIAGLAEYTANGGGSAQIKLRNSKVKYKSNDHQLEIEIGDFEFNGPLSSLGDKIQKAKIS